MGRTRCGGLIMAGNHEDRNERGPSWADVAEMINYVEKEHRCKVTWEMGASMYGKRGLVGSVFASRVQGRNDWYVCQRLDLRWPTSCARTIPALLVQRLWKLSDAMHDYDELPMFREAMPEATLPLPPDSF